MWRGNVSCELQGFENAKNAILAFKCGVANMAA